MRKSNLFHFMNKLGVAILTIVISYSCQKDSELIFSGITERDTVGNLTGNIDTTDWRFDDQWSKIESQLFNNFSTKTNSKLASNDIFARNTIFPKIDAYPNPSNVGFNISFTSDAITTLRIVIVNSNFEILISMSSDSIFSLTWSLTKTERSKFVIGGIYRVYYRLDFADGTVEKGHGDIEVKK